MTNKGSELLSINAETNSAQPGDPDQLCRLLDVALAAKRVAWERAATRNRIVRGMSYIFLFLVLALLIIAICFVTLRPGDQPPAQNQSITFPDK